MHDQAINKINDEMTASKNNPCVQVVGAFLLQHLAAHPEAANAIMVEGKTVAKSLDEMRKVAEGRKHGNCAVLTDQEGFAVVLKYFGIEGSAAKGETIPMTPSPVTVKQPLVPSPRAAFSVSLDDLL